MNAIFTICAKNYLAQAKTLGYSIKKYAKDADFFILLSDEIGGDEILCDDFKVIEANTIGIADFYQMAFKYDVIEFNTSIKPYFIEKLLKEQGYSKVLYIDPDMVVYNSVAFLFDELDHYSALITPHIIKPYKVFEGATPEEELLFVGIYNLGFFAVNNSDSGLAIVEWWKEKLNHQCYADKFDALHVDQRWMDFLPCLYTDEIKILKHPGVNVAFWNLHEREIVDYGDSYTVDGMPLVIFHFSGLDMSSIDKIARKQTKFNFSNKPELKQLFVGYSEELVKNGFNHLSALNYTYNSFKNGISILKYQRRLFRALESKGNVYIDPFKTGEGTFFKLLIKNGLIINDKAGKYQKLRKNISNIDGKIALLHKGLYLLRKIMGIKKYYLLMRFFNENLRFEDQLFLIKKK